MPSSLNYQFRFETIGRIHTEASFHSGLNFGPALDKISGCASKIEERVGVRILVSFLVVLSIIEPTGRGGQRVSGLVFR